MTPDQRAAIAQIFSEMSLLLAVSNIYLAGRYAEIIEGFDVNLAASEYDLKSKRKGLNANLVTSCIPALVVNAAAVFVFVQPLGTGKIPASDICAWGCDVFPLAYVIVFVFFTLLLCWSVYLTGRTVVTLVKVSHKLKPS